MYETNAVYNVTDGTKPFSGPTRLLEVLPNGYVALIGVGDGDSSGFFRVKQTVWDGLFSREAVDQASDPFLDLNSVPSKLPKGVAARLSKANQAISMFADRTYPLSSRSDFTGAVSEIASKIGRSDKTVKRWLNEWLRSGRNPLAVVRSFLGDSDGAPPREQQGGKKRGPKPIKPALDSRTPAQDLRAKIDLAYERFIQKQRLSWRDAFYEMLLTLFKVPAAELNGEKRIEVLLTPGLIQKYKLPTWYQFRHRCRVLKERELSAQELDLPIGQRGRSTAPGPGFFEIDATYFQEQLVSVMSKDNLVSRPTVYLIVDIFSDAITGYVVTLENPSWGVASLALFNCFSDKAATFDRLGMPYTSDDWPCRELPTMLRADRAELVSNMGQEFPRSGIRVNVTPSMTPEAKGHVENKNGEIKRVRTLGRFNLPGLYKKHRKRRESDGKKGAALNLVEFERILVEIILDLNRRPVRPRRLPRDAALAGSVAASRIGLYKWGLVNRPGFTARMSEKFAYEHLLTAGSAVMTTRGIQFKDELFFCDQLRGLGMLTSAIPGNYPIGIRYSPNYAGEIFFLNQKEGKYIPATNVDLEVVRLQASFAETREMRSTKEAVLNQAGLNHYAARKVAAKAVGATIKSAVSEKKELSKKPSTSKKAIRENRAAEKQRLRAPGMGGALPQSQQPSDQGRAEDHVSSRPPVAPIDRGPQTASPTKTQLLWSKVSAKST